MYVDIFVAGTGKWYEFKCEEKEKVKDIIEQIYLMIIKLENINGSNLKKDESEIPVKISDLYLVCIDSRKILLNSDDCLEECMVENGSKLILF